MDGKVSWVLSPFLQNYHCYDFKNLFLEKFLKCLFGLLFKNFGCFAEQIFFGGYFFDEKKLDLFKVHRKKMARQNIKNFCKDVQNLTLRQKLKTAF